MAVEKVVLELDHMIMQKLHVEDDPGTGSDQQTSSIIEGCNAFLAEIEDEIAAAHNLIRDNYRWKFPELESLVVNPVDYARIVKRMGNETDPTVVDLQGLLLSATIMVVSMTASITSGGEPLTDDVLQSTIDACDRVLALDSAKKRVVDFLGSQMGCVAPNLSAVVGGSVAAKLIGTAGGLLALARMQPSTVLLLGAKKDDLAGFSTSRMSRVGYLEQTETFRNVPPSLRTRVSRLLTAKSILAARVDSIGGDPSGETGTKLHSEIREKIDKWQQPPPARLPKPLPVPNLENRKNKRGGLRSRKRKERYGMTETRKRANRMQFGVPEESSLGDGLGRGYGMLIGRLHAAKKFKANKINCCGSTSGLAFSPFQGIQLPNPAHA